MDNNHLEAFPKQDKNQVQGTKKSKISKTVSNQQHQRRQTEKRTDGLHTGRPGQKQHRNNKGTYLYPTNNGNAIDIQLKAKSN